MVPISWGELIDKITILEIKRDKILTTLAQSNINKELYYLTDIVNNNSVLLGPAQSHKGLLKNVNLKLWEAEDLIREKDTALDFDSEFVNLAKSIYRLNDERASLKKQINELLKSDLNEEKSYKK